MSSAVRGSSSSSGLEPQPGPWEFPRVKSLRVFSRQALDPTFLTPHVWYVTQFDHRSGKLTGACLARLPAYQIHVGQGGVVTVDAPSSFLGLPRRFLLPSK